MASGTCCNFQKDKTQEGEVRYFVSAAWRFSVDDYAPNGGKAAGLVTVSQGSDKVQQNRTYVAKYPEPDVSQSSSSR